MNRIENNLQSQFLGNLINKNKNTGKFYSALVIHVGGAIGAFGLGVIDTLKQVALAIVKFVTGLAVSPFNFLVAIFSNSSKCLHNWGWTAALNHLHHAIISLTATLAVPVVVLFASPESARNIFYSGDCIQIELKQHNKTLVAENQKLEAEAKKINQEMAKFKLEAKNNENIQIISQKCPSSPPVDNSSPKPENSQSIELSEVKNHNTLLTAENQKLTEKISTIMEEMAKLKLEANNKEMPVLSNTSPLTPVSFDSLPTDPSEPMKRGVAPALPNKPEKLLKSVKSLVTDTKERTPELSLADQINAKMLKLKKVQEQPQAIDNQKQCLLSSLVAALELHRSALKVDELHNSDEEWSEDEGSIEGSDANPLVHKEGIEMQPHVQHAAHPMQDKMAEKELNTLMEEALLEIVSTCPDDVINILYQFIIKIGSKEKEIDKTRFVETLKIIINSNNELNKRAKRKLIYLVEKLINKRPDLNLEDLSRSQLDHLWGSSLSQSFIDLDQSSLDQSFIGQTPSNLSIEQQENFSQSQLFSTSQIHEPILNRSILGQAIQQEQLQGLSQSQNGPVPRSVGKDTGNVKRLAAIFQ